MDLNKLLVYFKVVLGLNKGFDVIIVLFKLGIDVKGFDWYYKGIFRI